MDLYVLLLFNIFLTVKLFGFLWFHLLAALSLLTSPSPSLVPQTLPPSPLPPPPPRIQNIRNIRGSTKGLTRMEESSMRCRSGNRDRIRLWRHNVLLQSSQWATCLSVSSYECMVFTVLFECLLVLNRTKSYTFTLHGPVPQSPNSSIRY